MRRRRSVPTTARVPWQRIGRVGIEWRDDDAGATEACACSPRTTLRRSSIAKQTRFPCPQIGALLALLSPEITPHTPGLAPRPPQAPSEVSKIKPDHHQPRTHAQVDLLAWRRGKLERAPLLWETRRCGAQKPEKNPSLPAECQAIFWT